MFPVFEIMAFQHVAGNSVNYDESKCDRVTKRVSKQY